MTLARTGGEERSFAVETRTVAKEKKVKEPKAGKAAKADKGAKAPKAAKQKREGGLVGRLTTLVAVLFTASLLAEKVAAGG